MKIENWMTKTWNKHRLKQKTWKQTQIETNTDFQLNKKVEKLLVEKAYLGHCLHRQSTFVTV